MGFNYLQLIYSLKDELAALATQCISLFTYEIFISLTSYRELFQAE